MSLSTKGRINLSESHHSLFSLLNIVMIKYSDVLHKAFSVYKLLSLWQKMKINNMLVVMKFFACLRVYFTLRRMYTKEKCRDQIKDKITVRLKSVSWWKINLKHKYSLNHTSLPLIGFWISESCELIHDLTTHK